MLPRRQDRGGDGASDHAIGGATRRGTWRATRSTAISTRFDARKPRGKQSWSRSIATGAVQSLADIAFVGVEWLQDLDGDDLLTLRWGLEIELLGP